MAVIPFGDGRLIEYDEGALRLPPPEEPVPKKKYAPSTKKRKVVRSKAVTIGGHKYKFRPPGRYKAKGRTSEEIAALHAIPGYTTWSERRRQQVLPGKSAGGLTLGRANFMTAEQSDRQWIIARKKARKDMEVIKQKIVLTDAAEEALEATLVTMRSPMSQQVKLAAAKLVLDFTMAKPVSKSEVSVNAAEAWLASIGKEPGE